MGESHWSWKRSKTCKRKNILWVEIKWRNRTWRISFLNEVFSFMQNLVKRLWKRKLILMLFDNKKHNIKSGSVKDFQIYAGNVCLSFFKIPGLPYIFIFNQIYGMFETQIIINRNPKTLNSEARASTEASSVFLTNRVLGERQREYLSLA